MEKENKNERNYLPALTLSLIWWAILIGMIVFVDPAVIADFPITGSYLLFFVVLFLAVWFLMGLLLGKSRRGVLAGLGAIFFLVLRMWGVGNWLNGILIAGLLVVIEVYLSK